MEVFVEKESQVRSESKFDIYKGVLCSDQVSVLTVRWSFSCLDGLYPCTIMFMM